MNYKALSLILALALVGLSAFAGGYAYGAKILGSQPRCLEVWTGQIPPAALPVFHLKYPNASDNAVYTVFSCTNGTTEAVKYCTLLVQADLPAWAPEIQQYHLYACRVS